MHNSSSSTASPRETGDWAENQAWCYLQKQGARLITRNYACRWGEIDLIIEHDEAVVFVEVRYRKQTSFASSMESIHQRKIKRIIATAKHYLQKTRQFDVVATRIDVVAISSMNHNLDIDWIQNAIEITY